MKRCIIWLLTATVVWIIITSGIQAFKNHALTQTQRTFLIPKNFILIFKEPKGESQ